MGDMNPREQADSATAARSASPPADDARIAEALGHLTALLVPGESLQAYAVQRRLFALTHRRVLVAATTGRFISLARGLIGGYTPVDVRWQDLEDAHLRAGVFGADLTITAKGREDLASAGHTANRVFVSGLSKAEAERVYRCCQAQAQSWREKRRVRDLDELRARSGGIQLGAFGGPSAPVADAAPTDPTARLQHAKDLLDRGLISDAEYESVRAKIVDRL